MRKEDIKVGMKVKVVGKHYGIGIYSSLQEWIEDEEFWGEDPNKKEIEQMREQGFGYVEKIEKDFVEVTYKKKICGWHFDFDDIEPYENKNPKIGDKILLFDDKSNPYGLFIGTCGFKSNKNINTEDNVGIVTSISNFSKDEKKDVLAIQLGTGDQYLIEWENIHYVKENEERKKQYYTFSEACEKGHIVRHKQFGEEFDVNKIPSMIKQLFGESYTEEVWEIIK